jgi:aspartyl-tRNA synthetase
MGSGDLQSIHPYIINKHRQFAGVVKKKLDLQECVILSKCNCVEIYYVSSSDKKNEIISLWKKQSHKPAKFKISDIYQFSGRKVIEHLFETACGLKSITLGDNQVVGQVRKAINSASDDKTAGIILKTVFNNARKISNTVRNTTNIGKGNVSAERSSVEMMIRKSVPKKATILIVGAGSTGKLIIKALKENGFSNLILANRTVRKSKELANKKLIKKAILLNQLNNMKDIPAVIFFATPKVFSKKQLSFLKKIRHVLIYDLGTPQNTSSVKSLYEIYNLKSINEYSEYNKNVRQNSIVEAKEIISSFITKTVDAMNYKLKEEERRKNFHTNMEVYVSKIPYIEIKSDVYFSVRKRLVKKGYTEVHTPTVTAVPTDPVRNDPSEEIFSVNWYGRKMLLRQSNQLYKQILALSGMDKLFELGPFWRAEQNPTPRHLSEAYGLDVEMTNVNNVNQLITLLKDILSTITRTLYNEKKITKHDIISGKIKKITYKEALDLLNRNNSGQKVNYGVELGYETEEKLGKLIKEKFNTDLFAIVNYPKSIKKFYTKQAVDDKTLSFDVFYKNWEIVSGAVRETNYNKLLNDIKDIGLKHQKYQFYLDAFKNPKSHGGFCLGIDRFLVKLLDLNSLSDLFLFPRSEYDIIP